MYSRSELRREALSLLRRGRVPLLPFVGFLTLIHLVLNVADTLCSGASYDELFHSGPTGFFVYFLTALIGMVLEMGRIEYCSRVRHGEEVAYGDLFCGFSFVFRVLSVIFLQAFLIAMGLSLFVIPGIFLTYRYRFSLYILSEGPDRGPVEILRQSGMETDGFKAELFLLDLSFAGWTLLAAAPFLAWSFVQTSFGSVADTCISGLLTFPMLLVNFWQTTTELLLREKILTIKGINSHPEF